jgi:hypothetical protein
MNFNKLIFDKLDSIFQKHNLQVVEQFENYVKFKSEKSIVVISHAERENSNSLYIGPNEDFLYPINENVLKKVFNSVLRIEKVTPEAFISNLELFFKREGNSLLDGDIEKINAIKSYIHKESEEYTVKLMQRQNLDAANKAWEEGNFKDFIKYLDKMDKEQLSLSYEKKYKIAQQKLNP